MSKGTLVTHIVEGADGAVRGLFQNRQLGAAASAELFPGVPQVAVMPTLFSSEANARAFILENAEVGGNAIAARFAHQQWLVGAYLSD